MNREIEQAIEQTLGQLSKAAERRDFSVISAMTEKLGELRTLQQQLAAIENRFRHIVRGNGAESESALPPIIREIGVEVSQGMINQNLLTLTDAVKKGLIRPGEKLSIQAHPSGDQFETELLGNGNKLRERGKIGRFYRDAEVHAGETVLLRETTPGQWELRKSQFMRYPRR